MKRVICVDIDGVLANDLFGLGKTNWGKWIINIFLFLPPVRFLYQLRPANKKIVECLKKRERRGDLIVITSQTWTFHSSVIKKWLKKQSIPWNFLILHQPGTLYFTTLKSIPWEIFIVDEERIALKLAELGYKFRRKEGIFIQKAFKY